MLGSSTDLALWAVANEARRWSAHEIASLRADPSSLASLLRVPKGKQRRLLSEGPLPAQRPHRALLDAADLDARLAGASTLLRRMARDGVQAIPLFSPSYPKRLATIPDPPLVLYARGDLASVDRCVGISGTRTPSQWGLRAAERLGRRLAEAGWTVASGLARGIDTAAHRGALSASRGRTVAVCALPLNRVYPSENAELAKRIESRGALVSEHGLATGAGSVEFLRRNRIASGLSAAHFIVETSGSGGTWAQATIAKAQGRPLLALRPPPSEHLAFQGFRALLRLGATPCASVDDAIAKAADLRAETKRRGRELS